MKNEKQKIQNGHHLTKYFTQFPNLLDDADLSPYEFRVLLHYYRVGECWEGVRSTAKKCKMSTGKVVMVRKSLTEKGFIVVQENEQGDGVTIRVVDKTSANVLKYECSPDEQGVHVVNGSVHVVNEGCSPDEHKNNPIKNNPLRKGDAPDEIPKRKDEFMQRLVPFVEIYGKSMVREFYDYWTELNDSQTKMRFEIDKSKRGVFEIPKRLATWKRRVDEKVISKKPQQEQATVASSPSRYHGR